MFFIKFIISWTEIVLEHSPTDAMTPGCAINMDLCFQQFTGMLLPNYLICRLDSLQPNAFIG